MKRKFIITMFLLLFILGGAFAWFYIKENGVDNNTLKQSNSWSVVLTETWNTDDEEIVLTTKVEKLDKIGLLKKKLALKWLIIKWDINLQNQEYTSALVKYLQIHNEIPEDKSITQKLWDVYFNLQKFKQAYFYYSKIKDYDKLDKDKVAKALISSKAINENNIKYLNDELDSLWLNEEQLFYYKTSLTCEEDFSLCKQRFQDYFKEKKEQEIVIEWSWSTDKTSKFKELYNIEKALTTYKNFQTNDLLYKWALVSWAFFENWLYPIAIYTSKLLLEQKSDYKPLIKIIAKSYYELWDYINAKLYLIEYNKLIDTDPDASYFLWIVYEKLHEYVLSTIHFQIALKLWHPEVLDINKRIIFNYFELWEIEEILKIFKTIIKNNLDELSINDFSLAIYYHIINDEIIDAKNFAKLSLEKFPESEILNWYMWWILMEEINSKAVKINNTEDTSDSGTGKINSTELKESMYSEAETFINKWLEIDSKNPMLNLVKWKLEINKWNTKAGFMYFKKTVSLDNEWDFWKIAKQELENIEINK